MQTVLGSKYLVKQKPIYSTYQKLKLPPCVSTEFILSFLTHAKGCYHAISKHNFAFGGYLGSLHPFHCTLQNDRNPFSCIKSK